MEELPLREKLIVRIITFIVVCGLGFLWNLIFGQIYRLTGFFALGAGIAMIFFITRDIYNYYKNENI